MVNFSLLNTGTKIYRYNSPGYSHVLHGIAALLLCLFCPAGASASPCRQGLSLAAQVNGSDAVAIITKTDRVERLSNGGLRVYFAFNEMIKRPLVENYDKSVPQLLYPQGGDQLTFFGTRRYLVFLKYIAPNSWTVRKCSYLEISRDLMVQDACTAISDLFSDSPYDREKLCLLKYPPSAPLRLVGQEITKLLPDRKEYKGAGSVAADFHYDPASSYQRVYFELDGRARKAFFGTDTVNESFPILGYVKTADVASKRQLERVLRKGRRLKFQGQWFAGNFVMYTLE